MSKRHAEALAAISKNPQFLRPELLLKVAKQMLDRQVWAQRMIGHVPLGVALFYAWIRDDRHLTAMELAQMADTSEDTARRALSKLVKIGRVECIIKDRVRHYRMADEFAWKMVELTPPLR